MLRDKIKYSIFRTVIYQFLPMKSPYGLFRERFQEGTLYWHILKQNQPLYDIFKSFHHERRTKVFLQVNFLAFAVQF